jgi:hypothetical protein
MLSICLHPGGVRADWRAAQKNGKNRKNAINVLSGSLIKKIESVMLVCAGTHNSDWVTKGNEPPRESDYGQGDVSHYQYSLPVSAF